MAVRPLHVELSEKERAAVYFSGKYRWGLDKRGHVHLHKGDKTGVGRSLGRALDKMRSVS